VALVKEGACWLTGQAHPRAAQYRTACPAMAGEHRIEHRHGGCRPGEARAAPLIAVRLLAVAGLAWPAAPCPSRGTAGSSSPRT
jgi:hypothetical protein